MAKFKPNFRRLSVPKKAAKARQIVTALTGNTNFPNPNPPLAMITASANGLDGAYGITQSTKQDLKTAVTDQSVKEEGLDQLVCQIASYVGNLAGNDKQMVT